MTRQDPEAADYLQLIRAAYEQGGQAAVTGDYQSGYTLGHDTGYSARQDSRAFVRGVLEGFTAGTEARQQLAHAELQAG
jgi:hypothetical protein